MNRDQQILKKITGFLKEKTNNSFEIIVQDGFALLRYDKQYAILKRSLRQLLVDIEEIKAILMEKMSAKPIEQTIEFAIAKELKHHIDEADFSNIIIDISDEEVYLEGTVSTHSKISKIGKIIWNIRGVKNVCNLLNCAPAKQINSTNNWNHLR